MTGGGKESTRKENAEKGDTRKKTQEEEVLSATNINHNFYAMLSVIQTMWNYDCGKI